MQQLDCCCEWHLFSAQIKNIEKRLSYLGFHGVTGTRVNYLCYFRPLKHCRHCCWIRLSVKGYL